MSDSTTSDRPFGDLMTIAGSARQLDDGRVEVKGPAIVRTPDHGDYEIQSDVSLRFTAGTEVWLRAEA